MIVLWFPNSTESILPHVLVVTKPQVSSLPHSAAARMSLYKHRYLATLPFSSICAKPKPYLWITIFEGHSYTDIQAQMH